MNFPSFHDRSYLHAEKIFPTDRLIAGLLLWMIPRWITPNHITLFRIIATPFTVLLLYDKHYAFGVPMFFFVAFTDAIDGALARTRNMITPWGMMFDPLADKLLIIPVVCILVFSQLNIAVAAGIVATELLIVVLALLWRHAGGVIQANGWGKIKMFLQVCGIIVLLLAIRFSSPDLVTIATIILTSSIAFGVVSIARKGI